MEKKIKVSVLLILVMILFFTTSVSAEWTTQFVEDERKENGDYKIRSSRS